MNSLIQFLRRNKRGILAISIALAFGFIIVVFATSQTYRMRSPGMEPTLKRGDRVIVSKVLYHLRSPHRGDLVAYHPSARAVDRCGSETVHVKRIVAVGGETWQERNGYVYIDGRQLSEPYINAEVRDRQTYPARRIPEGTYFLMGDNRRASCDSREWGPARGSTLIGPVIMTYWPLRRLSIR